MQNHKHGCFKRRKVLKIAVSMAASASDVRDIISISFVFAIVNGSAGTTHRALAGTIFDDVACEKRRRQQQQQLEMC